MNVVNSQSIHYLKEQGFDGVTLSSELNLEEINEISDVGNIEKEIIIYGPVRAMSIKYCPFSSLKNCTMDTDCIHCNYKNAVIKDETAEWFFTERENNTTSLYFQKRLETANYFDEILRCRCDSLRMDMKNENSPIEIFEHYKELWSRNSYGKNYQKEILKAHFKRGVE